MDLPLLHLASTMKHQQVDWFCQEEQVSLSLSMVHHLIISVMCTTKYMCLLLFKVGASGNLTHLLTKAYKFATVPREHTTTTTFFKNSSLRE